MLKNLISQQFLAAGAVALTGLFALPATAQKIQDHKAWGIYHKSPLLTLKPQYSTYSLDYDFGNTVMSVNNRPVLQGLTYQKADGDLLLRITVKGLFVSGRKITESNNSRTGYSAYYTLSYSGDFGYELRDVKTDQVLARYHKDGGTTTTQAFANRNDLEGYVNNAFVNDKNRQLLNDMSRRADFALNPHDYPAGLTLHTVEGDAPAYAALNKATASVQALLAASPNTPPDPARLQPLAVVWQQQLAQANWEDKKSPVNKKVANALLENLCATALLTENYPQLGEYAAQYITKNKGLFGDGSLSFLTDVGYGGLARTPVATFSDFSLRKTNEPERVAVFYDELVADVQPPK